MNKQLTRRDVNRALGLAGSSLLLAPGLARAATETPAQTEGPFYPVLAQDDRDTDLTRIAGHSESAAGEQILVRGRVLDTQGRVLEGATVDVWQANHYGRYSHPDDPNPNPLDPNFQGWGIMQTDGDGSYGFRTILPGAYAIGENSTRCRHIHFKVSHPDHETLTTQMYFEGDQLMPKDVVMGNKPEALRPLLIAKPGRDDATGLTVHRFEVVLG